MLNASDYSVVIKVSLVFGDSIRSCNDPEASTMSIRLLMVFLVLLLTFHRGTSTETENESKVDQDGLLVRNSESLCKESIQEYLLKLYLEREETRLRSLDQKLTKVLRPGRRAWKK